MMRGTAMGSICGVGVRIRWLWFLCFKLLSRLRSSHD